MSSQFSPTEPSSFNSRPTPVVPPPDELRGLRADTSPPSARASRSSSLPNPSGRPTLTAEDIAEMRFEPPPKVPSDLLGASSQDFEPHDTSPVIVIESSESVLRKAAPKGPAVAPPLPPDPAPPPPQVTSTIATLAPAMPRAVAAQAQAQAGWEAPSVAAAPPLFPAPLAVQDPAPPRVVAPRRKGVRPVLAKVLFVVLFGAVTSLLGYAFKTRLAGTPHPAHGAGTETARSEAARLGAEPR